MAFNPKPSPVAFNPQQGSCWVAMRTAEVFFALQHVKIALIRFSIRKVYSTQATCQLVNSSPKIGHNFAFHSFCPFPHSFLPPSLPIALLELNPHDLTPCHAIDFIRSLALLVAVWWTFVHLFLYIQFLKGGLQQKRPFEYVGFFQSFI